MQQSPRFDALGFAFRIFTDSRRLNRYLVELFNDLDAQGDGDAHRFEIRRVSDSRIQARYEVALDGELMATSESPEGMVTPFVQVLNRVAVEGCPDLVLHAGGVEFAGIGVALPGVTESGKTTLTAGLVRAGFAYLTDEAVAVNRRTRIVRPYPKPLSIDPGSWALFPELEPHSRLENDAYKARQWLVPSRVVRDNAVASPCQIGVVVFPRYDPGSLTVLEPMSRGEALVELTKNTFAFPQRSRASLDVLADVARNAECYRLTLDGLDRAVELVADIVGLPRRRIKSRR